MKQYNVQQAVEEMDSLMAALINEMGKENIEISQLVHTVSSFPMDIYEIKKGEKAVYLQMVYPPKPVFYFVKNDVHLFSYDIKEIKQFLLEENLSPVRQAA